MELVVITAEGLMPSEARILQTLFEEGLDWLHIRKPGMPSADLERLIKQISTCWYPKIILHDNAELAMDVGLGGFHVKLNDLGRVDRRNGMEISTSSHGIQEFHAASLVASRIFISPLFNSISKPGYTANASLKAMGNIKRSNKLVALGGVCPHHLPELEMWGFDAAAFMGFLWQDAEPVARFREAISLKRKSKIEKRIAPLHYITHLVDGYSMEQQVHDVCWGGCRWVQFRMKNVSDALRRETAEKLLPIARSYGATFIINDDPLLAKAVDADGVHLGKEDGHPSEARQILGPDKIIGATANTLEDIRELSRYPIDYLGVGPFRFTRTKDKLSPILGLDGYRQLLQGMHQEQIAIPVVAIGGIDADDISSLLQAGVHGVALSGIIHRHAAPERACRELLGHITA